MKKYCWQQAVIKNCRVMWVNKILVLLLGVSGNLILRHFKIGNF